MQFDLVHAHCPFTSGRLARQVAKQQHIPFVATFHSKYRQDFEHNVRSKLIVDLMVKHIIHFFEQADEVWIPLPAVEETLREYGFKGRHVEGVENGNDFYASKTQIANMRIGQPVTITTDIYGDDVKYTGKVVGLDMGTGSAFSLLPAQNATGNWIKVVQRLPVRIELDQKQLEQYPLRIGLSTLVSVNTTNRDGQVLANKVRSTPVAVSTAREISLAPVNKLIDDIVKANAG